MTPRSEAEMRALLFVGLPVIQSYIAGTPISESSEFDTDRYSGGEPADAATGAAVTETIEQFIACGNAGIRPAVAATLTNSGASAYLSFAALSFMESIPGVETASPTTVDPALIDGFLQFIEVPVPLPADQRVNYFGTQDVTQLSNDLVIATVVLSTGSAEPDGPEQFMLRDVADGDYRILFGTEAIVGDELKLPEESLVPQATPGP